MFEAMFMICRNDRWLILDLSEELLDVDIKESGKMKISLKMMDVYK